ncbi:MAG: MBL fold metallo-hydrolase, partial [Methanomassiliicoccaceae archaeon]|nr:MBL fold metallo-hydrolase [Methanomassiliicoccaceae archaeon]
MEMKFRFLGGADAIGRMGMTMQRGNDISLFEYGMSPTKPPEYPLECRRVDRVFLTHSHLDHCGMIPSVCGRDNCELFATPVSAEVGEILMNDSLKIAKADNYPLPYTRGDIDRTMRNVVPLTFGDTIELKGFDVALHTAGHIPGATMFEIIGDTSTVYSGDIHTISTRLVGPAHPVDCENLFVEGTYGGRLHRPRKEEEKAFLNKIAEVTDRGGRVLIPCFATGRTQEMMLLLKNSGYDMWVDGMGRSVTRLYMNYPEYLLDFKKFKGAKRAFQEVRNPNMRSHSAKGEVIVTTGGMLDGGPVLGYLREMGKNPKNAVLLVGYQAEDTNGRMLLEHGCIMMDGQPMKIECEVHKYDFSAHADHEQILEFIRGCSPKNVIIMHSDTREAIKKDLEGNYNVILPELG